MKKISIYNSFIKNNNNKREIIASQLKKNGFYTSRNGDLLIVLGGDGTFLSAVRKRMDQNPVFVGFNTGNLGFFSEFDMNELDQFIQVLKTGDYYVQEYPVYEVIMKDAEEEIVEYFVNDLVIERKSTRVLHMGIQTGAQKLCSISGDGVVISSAAGSTGYNVAAGGSILMDCNDCIQVSPIAPVFSKAYHSLRNSLILRGKNDLTIFPNVKKQRPFRIVCDGKELKTKTTPKFIEVRETSKRVRVLRSNNYSPINNIRDKILEDV